MKTGLILNFFLMKLVNEKAICGDKHLVIALKKTWNSPFESHGHGLMLVIIPTTCCAVPGSTARAGTSPDIATNNVQKIFRTSSFFPN